MTKRAPWVLAAAVTVVLLALASRYGPHRDELYFVLLGRHPQWGYPDQPPLTPLVARLADLVAPGSLTVLRLVPALLIGGLVLLGADFAKLLGGDRWAQNFTALMIAAGGLVLFAGHILSTATLDLFLQAVVIRAFFGALRVDPGPRWLGVGLAVGIGLQNKSLVAFLAGALVVGIAVTPSLRRHLVSPWAWGGAVIAAVFWAPDLIWQARHGWPQFTLAGEIRDEYGGPGGIAQLLLLQFTLISFVAVLVAWGGWKALWRKPDWAFARPVAVAYPLLLVFYALTGGKFYYLAGLIVPLAAAGAVVLKDRKGAVPLVFVVALIPLPALLPILPQHLYVHSFYPALNEDGLETVGWPKVVGQIRDATAEHSPNAVIITENYGEAGALDWYGVDLPVYSGHNGLAAFGPPPDFTDQVWFVGDGVPAALSGCQQVATLDTGADNEETGNHVWRCPGPAGSWAQVWPRLSHLDA